MSKILLLYGYNKYNNRIIKKEASFADYQALITPADANTPAQYKGLIRDNVNFDYQDGVHSILILNVKLNDPTALKLSEPDYLVLLESIKEGSNAITKLSRWFVLDANRIRGNQYRLSLRRDLLADYYNEVINAPVFIERGIPLIDDPVVFNRESFTYNQIKKGELLLDFNKLSGKGKGWIVGYLAREDSNHHVTTITNAEGHAEIPEGALEWDDIPASIQDLINNQRGWYNKPNSYDFTLLSAVKNRSTGNWESWAYVINNVVLDRTVHYETRNFNSVAPPYLSPYVYFEKYRNNAWYLGEVCNYLKNVDEQVSGTSLGIGSKLETWYNAQNYPHRFTNKSIIDAYNGIVYHRGGHIYKLKIKKVQETSHGVSFTRLDLQNGSGSAPALAIALNYYINEYVVKYVSDLYDIYKDNETPSTNIVAGISRAEEEYEFVSEIAEFDVVKASIPDTRNEVLDAPYDMFCIPVGEVSVKSSGTVVLTNAANTAIAIARGIAIKGTTALVYDIQYLPYCPFGEIIDSDGNIDITGYTEAVDYSYITKTVEGVDSNVGIILYPKSCRGTFNLDIPSNNSNYSDCIEEINDVVQKKIKSETKLCRFVSPNFSSTFEINVQKNKGIVNLNVDYFYKPYSPYIHVAPYFSGLYGEDFNDPKGLICSGDFSIASASSKWEEYQIQNKNYELIFNRNIQNLDVNNSIAYEQLKITGKLGVVQSAMTGAAAGMVTGAAVGSAAGPWGTALGAVGGAVVGGVTSGVASGYGAKMDLEFLSKSQKEARSYMEDMYTYQLGNIQALPYSLTRVSAFTENNKIFPFLEFYDCTEKERIALDNKIFYNGMTIMRIGYIKDFIGENGYRFVQGTLIRLLNLDESNHVIAEIGNEIKEGAYYYGSDTE